MKDFCTECSFAHSTCICDMVSSTKMGKTFNVNSTYIKDLELFNNDENIDFDNILNINIADSKGDHNINGKQSICLKNI